ncbi:MAG: hypothetical protein ACRDTQ_15590 [Micromonosporaceae bacterium]
MVVDIVDWLSSNPNTAEQIKTVAGKISTEVVDGLDQSFDPAQREQRRRELATSHFWCDLLATFARVLNSFQQEIGKIPDIVAAELVKAIGAERSQIGTVLVRLAVGAAWKLIKEIPFARQHVIRLIQMLAVMICPAPESHRDVVKYCVTPLTGGCVKDVTKERLKQTMPEEWLQ